MRKILIILLCLFLTACQSDKNTPTSRVESFLSKYQNLDSEVISELDKSIEKNSSMNEEQKEEYKSIIEKQYQNLSYKIKNEEIIGDVATVDVEIEVLDYSSAIVNAKKYYLEHESEFTGNKVNDEDIDNETSYIDYKLKRLRNTKDKTKYEIIFDLEKDNNIWQLKEISEDVRKKLHGLY